ncbi:cuticle protein-like [Ctenocephalides felis]|uniref:cuticle protein-like n=1 Tax=Ctenocephalides felis TaxID=7515 RepID=UPI000E6E1CD1|nr:cuticle protein-like [Ctenocephalides felis]
MAFKFICFASVLAFASAIEPTAQYHKGAYGVVPTVYKTHVVEAEAPAQYEFQYSVNDQHTGDVKEQKESRNGDSVRGHYSLIDADGHKRTVEYSVDGDSGFVAVVHREPVHGYAPAKVVTKVAAAPVYQAYQAAPTHVYQQQYEAPKAAPVAYQTYSAPAVAKVAAPVAYQTYTAPAVAKVAAPVAYQTYTAPAVAKVAAPVAYQTYTAPAVAKVAEPVAYQTYTAPAVAKVATPVVYSQAPVHQHGYATHTAPLSAFKTVAAPAPVVKVAAAPAPVYQQVHAASVAKVTYQPVAKVAVPAEGHSYVTYSGPNSSYQY